MLLPDPSLPICDVHSLVANGGLSGHGAETAETTQIQIVGQMLELKADSGRVTPSQIAAHTPAVQGRGAARAATTIAA